MNPAGTGAATAVIDWVRGDLLGLDIPAHGGALRAGGEDFLTAAFHASGLLATDNRVRRITRCEDFQGGGTGTKLLLSVAYEQRAADLPQDLFVKFSRNFHDPIRDRPRYMMLPEVQFALLSRTPGFPITVPRCVCADFHLESGTGILITQRIAYGEGGLERHYQKCLDHDLPQPLAHYQAIIRSLARLSGSHQAGRLPDAVTTTFPFDPEQALANDRMRYDERQLLNRIARLTEFAASYPQLLPANIRAPGFLARLADDIPRLAEQELAIKRFLHSTPGFIALCHWNANIDNAWFWRDAAGELACGLMDWGQVGQMSVAQSIYGCFSGAQTALWDRHLDDIVALFIREFRNCGGSALDHEELTLHVVLFTAMMGVAYLMDAPAIITARLPDLPADATPMDARIHANEDARVQLHMLTMFLNQWQTRNVGQLVEQVLRRAR